MRAGDVRPNPKNWRKHPKAQQDALRGVLAEVGYADALLAREMPDGSLMLVDGHLRAETTPDMMVPVLVLDVNEAEADKILATLDPLAAMADTDGAKLDALLREVNTGSEALQEMLAGLADDAGLYQTPEATPGAGGDEFDAKPEEGPTRAKAGDLWVIGGVHRLLVGDCTVKENVERLMGGAKPFMMVTDPPYGVEYDPAWRNEMLGPGAARRLGQVTNDGVADWSSAWKLFTGDVAYVWHASLHIGEVQQSLIAADLLPRSLVIWAKNVHAISRGHYHWQHEPCWYVVRKGSTATWAGDRSQTTLWQIPIKDDTFDSDHGTQKPLECMARPIRNHGAEGDIVYDPFLGSGTTIIAAHRLGRKAYGCELEPKYADVVLKRAEAEGLDVRKEG